jgi:transposase-like protein
MTNRKPTTIKSAKILGDNSSFQDNSNPFNFTLNSSGIPVPTLEYLQSELSKVTTTDQMVGPDSVFAKLFQNTLNAVLQAEMENHLGYRNNQKTRRFKKDQIGEGGDFNSTYNITTDDPNPNSHPNSLSSPNYRNGYNSKNIKSQYGIVEIDIPRDRVASFEPQIIAKHQTSTNDFEHQILALYTMGNSTNEISNHFKEIYGFDVSDTYISTVTEKVLPLVKDWLNRPLQAVYPIVYLDAIRYKVREGGGVNGLGGKIIDKAVHIVLGIGLDGRKDVLGLYISQNESAKFWMSVLSDIKARGVQDILLCSTDNLTGFTEAIQSIFPDTKHQKCVVHQIRNSTKFVSYQDLKPFTQDLKLVYTARDENQAKEQFEIFKTKWSKDYGYAVKSWEVNWAELMTFMEYPQEIRKLIYTTNPIEGLNRQLRKVTSKRSIYPNDESLLKNLYLVITKLNDKWTMPIRNWGKILNQLTILFEDRIIKFINQ